jgi:hypothetical protein
MSESIISSTSAPDFRAITTDLFRVIVKGVSAMSISEIALIRGSAFILGTVCRSQLRTSGTSLEMPPLPP